MANKIFVNVTNKDIYDEMKRQHEENIHQHNMIISRLDVTNGKVKLNRWVATTGLTLAVVAIGYLFTHINK